MYIFGGLGLVTTGSIVGSLVTVIIQHFLQKNKLKTERENLLNREIYFKLQDKVEKIRFGMQVLTERMNFMNQAVKLKYERDIFDANRPKDEYHKERLDLAVCLETYFQDIDLKPYNRCMGMFEPASLIYVEFLEKEGNLFKEKAIQLNNITNVFIVEMKSLSNKIQGKLEEARKKII